MKYEKPFDASDPNASYVNGNPSASVQGSIPSAEALERHQRDLVDLIAFAGLTPSGSDLTQVRQAVLSLIATHSPTPPTPTPPAPVTQVHTGTAAVPTNGTAAALTVTDLNAPISNYPPNGLFWFIFPAGFADNGTINVAKPDGTLLGALPAQHNDGSPIKRADVPVGAPAPFICYGGTAFRLLGFGYAEVPRIGANSTLYVRIDGNDNNNGLTNTQSGAFATVTAALLAGTSASALASSALTIQLGIGGTYAAPGVLPQGAGTIRIVGDPANQGAYVLEGVGTPGGGVVQSSSRTELAGLTIRNTSTNAHTVVAVGSGANILLTNVSLVSTGTTSQAHAFCNGGSMSFSSGCIIQGNAFAALWSEAGGNLSVSTSVTLTIAGSPTFSTATAFATNGSRITMLGGASVSGSASGQRYSALNYSIITTNGGGVNFFPGSSAGSVSNSIYQ